MPGPRTYIFDLDGTLIDSLPGIEQALTAAFATLHRTFPPNTLRPLIGPPIRTIARRLDPTLTDAETLEIERNYRAFYDDDSWKNTRLFPEVESTLKALHRSGHKLFVLTNKPALPARRILDHFALTDLFTAILTRDSSSPAFVSKSAMLAHLLAYHDLDPKHCLLVGDTPEDAAAAHANHLPCVLMSFGYGEIEPAQTSLNTFSSLLNREFQTA